MALGLEMEKINHNLPLFNYRKELLLSFLHNAKAEVFWHDKSIDLKQIDFLQCGYFDFPFSIEKALDFSMPVQIKLEIESI
jgi:hypothetical protein